MGGGFLMANIPSLTTWAPGDTPTAQKLNKDLRDAYSFLANPPRAKVYHTTGQTITATGTVSNDTVMLWNTKIYDNDGIFSGSIGSPSSRLTARTAGCYQIMLHIDWDRINQSSPGNRFTAVKLNANGDNDLDTNLTQQIGNDIARITNSDNFLPQTSHISFQYFLSVGDYIEACVGTSYSSQGTVGAGLADRTFFGMRWISAS